MSNAEESDVEVPDAEDLLVFLKLSRSFDFTGYKRPSLLRRIAKRLQTVGVDNYQDYIDYLEVHPEEFSQLFNTILINVTGFFRDAASWDYLREEIVPRIMARKRAGEAIRAWSAGCASGEEAYTIAMVMAEALGLDTFRDRVKIYATDVDDEALLRARHASYSAKEMAAIPPTMRDKYFERTDNRYVFRKDLRRSVIFGRHDLIQDAPISRIDLLVCRNTLMYFNSETQSRVLARFHFALNDGGFLFLGRAEMLFSHSNLFTPMDVKRRILAKVARASLREHLLLMAQISREDSTPLAANHSRIREAAFDTNTVALVVIDTNGAVALLNERARSLFNLSLRDVGRPLQDLELSYRPIELRSAIDQAYADHRTITLKEISWPTSNGDARWLDLQVIPLHDSGNNLLGVSVAFIDMTRYKRMQEDLAHANQELETAYEELQSTNEELETTNEELQSTVEELETTNEELQSTNEELETMNEELQSTNEELQTMNDEMRRRGDELNQVNAFLEYILTSLRSGVVVVDKDLYVQIWNRRAEDLWGLRAEEVHGKNFLNLDIGLPVEQLRQSIRACLSGDAEIQETTLNATNRRGRPIVCKVSASPLAGPEGEIRGALLLMEEIG